MTSPFGPAYATPPFAILSAPLGYIRPSTFAVNTMPVFEFQPVICEPLLRPTRRCDDPANFASLQLLLSLLPSCQPRALSGSKCNKVTFNISSERWQAVRT